MFKTFSTKKCLFFFGFQISVKTDLLYLSVNNLLLIQYYYTRLPLPVLLIIYYPIFSRGTHPIESEMGETGALGQGFVPVLEGNCSSKLSLAAFSNGSQSSASQNYLQIHTALDKQLNRK